MGKKLYDFRALLAFYLFNFSWVKFLEKLNIDLGFNWAFWPTCLAHWSSWLWR